MSTPANTSLLSEVRTPAVSSGTETLATSSTLRPARLSGEEGVTDAPPYNVGDVGALCARPAIKRCCRREGGRASPFSVPGSEPRRAACRRPPSSTSGSSSELRRRPGLAIAESANETSCDHASSERGDMGGVSSSSTPLPAADSTGGARGATLACSDPEPEPKGQAESDATNTPRRMTGGVRLSRGLAAVLLAALKASLVVALMWLPRGDIGGEGDSGDSSRWGGPRRGAPLRSRPGELVGRAFANSAATSA